MLKQVEDQRYGFRIRMLNDMSGVKPSRLAVMRPWPMPSVIEPPEDFISPVV
jgi:hypothetical protein